MWCDESSQFWCTDLGQLFVGLLVLVAAVVIYRLIMKSWSKPRDMSKYSQITGTFSSVVDKVDDADESEQEAEDTDQNEDDEEDDDEDDDEDNDDEDDEENFDIDEAFVEWQEENKLPDLTNASVIGEFFGFNNAKEIAIAGYDPENKEFLLTVKLVTGEITSFYFSSELIDFMASSQSIILMNVVFEEYFLESEFTWEDAESIEESLAKIDWNSNIFTEENCKKIKIHLTEAAYLKALRTKIC